MMKIYQKIGKRILDFIGALVLSPFVLVICIPIAILIKLDDGGSVFFCGDRYGEKMKKFKMIKFRTMIMNAPDIRNEDGSTYNSVSDPRLTKIGGVLRKTSIDELPQIFNVLIGNMSFIGPRPSPMGNESTYDEVTMKKFSVRPGITGYNQALLRNSATMEERYKNDVYYAEHISIGLDVKILVWTLKNVVKRENIYNS